MQNTERRKIRIERITGLGAYWDQLRAIHQQRLAFANAADEPHSYEKFVASLAIACARAHVFAIIDETGLIRAISVATVIHRPLGTEYYLENWFVHVSVLESLPALHDQIKETLIKAFNPTRAYMRVHEGGPPEDSPDYILQIITL